jgi:Cytochrome c-type protein NrfB-like
MSCRRAWRHGAGPVTPCLLGAWLLLGGLAGTPAVAQESAECLACHGDRDMTTERDGRTVSLYVSEKAFSASVHAAVTCIGCHADLAGMEGAHDVPVERVECGSCHAEIAAQHAASLHGQALKRGDRLAPRCVDCHGNHDIVPVKDHASPVSPLRIPFTCGRCHREGSPVARRRAIHQDHILENYSESIHGEGLLRKGLVVAPNCASCHTAHNIRPHTDPASSISRGRIAQTCTQCHAEIEEVHRKVIKGELWEKKAHVLPACIDCHPPHKIRKVFYEQGMADADCLRCHARKDIRASDGRSLFVAVDELQQSRHAKVACSQCHSEVNVSRQRPCETIVGKVDCASCHAEAGQQFQTSVHGQLLARRDPNAPSCKECHGEHGVKGHLDPASPTFPTNIPALCARCHREGEKAAVRYTGPEHQIIKSYTQSIHGKGLLKSGLTVTATCTNCHTAHAVLPRTDPASTVNPANVPKTCGACHHGIEEEFEKSVHHTMVGKTDKPLPVCNDCHSAHTIQRADASGFKLEIMQKCGRCHAEIAATYFDTYHGKVSQLGYTKTAKCYDCHGAHDILKVTDPRSHLARDHVVETCRKCHPGATRRFAGYLTHATHHDPRKYPFLFWAFWGMTTLLVGTFVVGGAHTLLWLPRALQMRRELREAEEAEERALETEAGSPAGGGGEAAPGSEGSSGPGAPAAGGPTPGDGE